MYLLDANVFISAKGIHYGMDFCPGFWDWLIKASNAGVVASIRQVADELQDDELNLWLPRLGDDFFREPDEDVLEGMKRVSAWVNAQNYKMAGKTEFLNVADYHLVSHALAGKHVVVTTEGLSNSKHKVYIPNVCNGLRIGWMPTEKMLRNEGVRLVLGE